VIDHESPAAHTFLALARRRCETDAARCGLAFAQLGAAARLRGRLREALARHNLSDLEFATLVVLFAGEPEAIPMAVLAEQTAVSRSAMTDTLDAFEQHQLASRTRDRSDRRILRVHLTAAGREKVSRALDDYLHAATHDVDPSRRS